MPIGLRTWSSIAVFLSVAASGCSAGGPTDVNSARVRVVIETVGTELDIDGYDILVDGKLRYFTFTQANRIVEYLSPGTHTLALERVAGNCTVEGPQPRSVTVGPFETVDVRFVVTCVTTAIEVTLRTSGVFVPETVFVAVDTRQPVPLPANGSVVVGRLSPGGHAATLIGRFDHCIIPGGTQRIVEVALGSTVSVSFDVTCSPPTRLEKIAFASDTSIYGFTNASVQLISPDGTGAVRLASGHSPAWSPDGARLVYSTTFCDFYYGAGCNGSLFVMDPETLNRFRLPDAHAGVSPAWSPSGDAIAYVRCCNFSQVSSRLYVATLDGKPDQEVVLPPLVAAYEPAWSPDGRRILFSCASLQQNFHDLCVVNRDGSDFSHLTSGPESDRDPAWSPDGTRIAFTRSQTGLRRITVMILADRSITELGTGGDPTWSRDGSKLAFSAGDGIFVVNSDGSGRKRLTNSLHYAPAWRP